MRISDWSSDVCSSDLAAALATGGISESRLAELVGATPFVEIAGLRAGYGKMQILHEFSLQIGKGQALCLIGPNGAGKSTVLHPIFGFTNIYGGRVPVGGKGVTRLSPKDKGSETRRVGKEGVSTG